MTIILGDCVEVMNGMEPESVDAICCDPPYGLEFMGKEWDSLRPSGITKRGGRAPGPVEAPAQAPRTGRELVGAMGGHRGGRRRMTMCESDRGEWGQRCPDCGKRLPARQKPLTSWMAARSTDAEASAKASAAITDAMQLHLGPRRRKAA
jgi:hypothetical protein